jgi:hypothetical protein
MLLSCQELVAAWGSICGYGRHEPADDQFAQISINMSVDGLSQLVQQGAICWKPGAVSQLLQDIDTKLTNERGEPLVVVTITVRSRPELPPEAYPNMQL